MNERLGVFVPAELSTRLRHEAVERRESISAVVSRRLEESYAADAGGAVVSRPRRKRAAAATGKEVRNG